MKKTFILIALVALFSHCSEEPTTPTTTGGGTTAATVVGTWNFASVAQNNGEISLAGTVISTYTATSSNEMGTYTFDADGTVAPALFFHFLHKELPCLWCHLP